jgi:hypothetical protein
MLPRKCRRWRRCAQVVRAVGSVVKVPRAAKLVNPARVALMRLLQARGVAVERVVVVEKEAVAGTAAVATRVVPR